MELTERVKRYQAIEVHRERPLIVYATSTRQGIPAMMAGDAVREFIDQIDAIEDRSKEVDILIHSTGGDALAAWKLMSILRERFSNVSVLVPFMAFSAATLFSLGADEIVMHPYASLGPIDPQINVVSDGGRRSFSFEDVGAFLRFVTKEVGITEQVYVSGVIDKLFSVVDPVGLGSAKRASELSASVGERLLLMHMTTPEDRTRAAQIAEDLNKSFFSHGDAVSRTRARELQLKVADDDPDLESLMWEAYLGLESHMDLRRPYDHLRVFLAATEGAEALAPVPPLQLPPDTPDQIAQQMWNHVAQQAINRLANPGVEVHYSMVHAVVESTRRASEFRSEGMISACRMPGGKIQVVPIQHSSGWEPVDMAGIEGRQPEDIESP